MAGKAFQAQGRMEEAAGAFGRMLKLAPNDSHGWTDIARVRLARGDQGGAGIAAGRAVRINPRNVDAIIFRGTLIRDQYGLRAALPWFRKALAIDRNNVPALGEYAATLGEIGRTRQMLALTRKMIALDPGNPRAFFMPAAMRSEEHTSELQSLMRIS